MQPVPSTPFVDLFERNYHSQSPLITLLYFYKNDVPKLFFSAIFFIIKHSGVWAMPIITASIVDVVAQPDKHALSELWLYTFILIIIFAQNIPMQYLFIWTLSSATRTMETNLRSALSRQLQHLSMDYYYRNSTGTLQTKLVRDVEMIQQLTRQLFEGLPAAGITLTVAVVVTAIRVPQFLIFFLLTVPAAAILVRRLRTPIEVRNHTFRAEVESMADKLSEMIRLIPITRAHGLEENELEDLEVRLARVKEAGVRLDTINALFGAAAWVTFRFFDVFCLVASAYLAFTHILPLTVGDVVLLTGFFSGLTNAVLQLATMFPDISKGLESVKSVGEVLDCPDLEQNEGKQVVEQVTGRFSFDHVSFSYPDTNDSSIKDVRLEVNPGETIAFVGPSGAGKSTLLNLIIGFRRPSSGRILLDGVDMNTLDLRTYRHFLSVVSQETILFKASVRDNILYGTSDIGPNDFRNAIERANAAEFIDALPEGEETIIGENGVRLSGGQRQRIAIARALIRNPRVLILDEATSALDTTSERLIQEALARLVRNRTTFVVAHRLSTIRNADRIVVLDNGQIVEIGTHDQLLAKNGAYSRLYNVQAA